MSPSMEAITTTTEVSAYYKLLARGKIRDLYEIDASTLLFVATDRMSAFDVVLANGIPDKGALLSTLSAYWFSILTSRIPSLKTHFITLDLPEKLANTDLAPTYQARSMQVRRLKVLPLESIVRGYITGGAWSEYKKSGTVHGLKVREGLRECEQFDKPMWTPSTKAKPGEHDENITPAQAAEIVGQDYADQIERISLQLYTSGRDHAAERGIIIADTKFEFGIDESTSPPTVILIDEVLTPDSSRFWAMSKYEVGRSQESLDKQPLRDWLLKNGLKNKLDVVMPPEVVGGTRERYVTAYEQLTGKKWT